MKKKKFLSQSQMTLHRTVGRLHCGQILPSAVLAKIFFPVYIWFTFIAKILFEEYALFCQDG